MKILKKINVWRRRLTQGITQNIGDSNFDPTAQLHIEEVKRILICRPNHRLGNLLLITPLVQEVAATFPDAKIDLFIKGNLGPVVFQNYPAVDRIIKLPKKHFDHLWQYFGGWAKLKKHKYDIVINVVKKSSSGRLSAQLANAEIKFFGDLEEDVLQKYLNYEHMAKQPVYSFRSYLNQLGFSKNELSVPSLNLKLSTGEIEEAGKLLRDIVKNDKKTICIFTYATGAKCYSESWWEEFYDILKKEYKEYNIVEVLPVENVSQINFKASNFYSKDIREICAFIANAEVFIGADSGMMHLASASQTPTVGLFSVTNPQRYQPYGNRSLAINTKINGMETIIPAVNKILYEK